MILFCIQNFIEFITACIHTKGSKEGNEEMKLMPIILLLILSLLMCCIESKGTGHCNFPTTLTILRIPLLNLLVNLIYALKALYTI
jgi:hypothetical protein